METVLSHLEQEKSWLILKVINNTEGLSMGFFKITKALAKSSCASVLQ